MCNEYMTDDESGTKKAGLLKARGIDEKQERREEFDPGSD